MDPTETNPSYQGRNAHSIPSLLDTYLNSQRATCRCLLQFVRGALQLYYSYGIGLLPLSIRFLRDTPSGTAEGAGKRYLPDSQW